MTPPRPPSPSPGQRPPAWFGRGESAAPAPLAVALPQVATGSAGSPWTPAEPALAELGGRLDDELAALRAEAAAAGRRDGLAELEHQRATVAAICGALERGAADRANVAAGVLAEVAVAIVEVWLDRAPDLRRDVLVATLRRWLVAAGTPPVIAVVHPMRVDTVRGAVAGALEVTGDPTVGADDLRILRGDGVLEHRLVDALAALRGELVVVFAATEVPA